MDLLGPDWMFQSEYTMGVFYSCARLLDLDSIESLHTM